MIKWLGAFEKVLKAITCTLVQTGRFLAATGYVAFAKVCIYVVILFEVKCKAMIAI